MACNFVTALQHVKISETDILALHTHVLGREEEGEHEGGNVVDYSWFKDIHNQELLLLVHQTVLGRAKQNVAATPTGGKRAELQFRRGHKLRAMLIFKPSTAGHILIPKGGSRPDSPAPCVMFITEHGHRVMPFLQTFAASGTGLSVFRSLPEDLHAYVDPYELTSPHGVVKLASVVDPSHTPSLDIAAYFRVPPDSEADSGGGEGALADVPVAGLRRRRGGRSGRGSGKGSGRKKAAGSRDVPMQPKRPTRSQGRGGGRGRGGGEGRGGGGGRGRDTRQSTIAVAFQTSVEPARAAEVSGGCASVSELVGGELTASDVDGLADFSSQGSQLAKDAPVINLIDEEEEEEMGKVADVTLRGREGREGGGSGGSSGEVKMSPTAEIIQNDFDSFFQTFDCSSDEPETTPPPPTEPALSAPAVPWSSCGGQEDPGPRRSDSRELSMEMDSTDMLLLNCPTPLPTAVPPHPTPPPPTFIHATPPQPSLVDITNSPRKSPGSALSGRLGSGSSGSSDLVAMTTTGSSQKGKRLRSLSSESSEDILKGEGRSEFNPAVASDSHTTSDVMVTSSDVIMISSGEEGGESSEREQRRKQRMRGRPEDVFRGKSDVTELTLKEIKRWMFLQQDTIFGIFKGTVHSWRHEDYTSNPKKRAALHFQLGARLFTEEQTGLISKELVRVFCSRHMKFFSYVMSVLYPEVLTRLVAGVHRVSFQEAERIMYSWPAAPTSSSSDSDD